MVKSFVFCCFELYCTQTIEVNQDGLKLNGTNQLLFYADDVNMFEKGKIEALVVTSKEIGPEVNADKTKYMVMSLDKNAGRSSRYED
jgi:hypothetical protein